MTVKVKICGITNLEDALHAAESGADDLGFNFFEKSSRYIAPHNALGIIEKLPIGLKKIGVFVNEESERISELVDTLNLECVQLHGDEDHPFIAELRQQTDAKIIKAFRISSSFDPNTISSFEVDGVLLDTYSAEAFGGTGETFNWQTALAIKEIVPDFYLAGGLTPDNLEEAIRTVRPYAVDVASGVESSPGKKDPAKVATFIKLAKR